MEREQVADRERMFGGAKSFKQVLFGETCAKSEECMFGDWPGSAGKRICFSLKKVTSL